MIGRMDEWEFEAALWVTESTEPWVFLTVPPEVDEQIRHLSGPRTGFGSVRVEVTVGGSTWRTSVFPDKVRGYVLPVRKAVRRAESLDIGDQVRVRLRLV